MFDNSEIKRFQTFCKKRGFIIPAPGEFRYMLNKHGDIMKLVDEKTIELTRRSDIVNADFEEVENAIIPLQE